MNTPREGWANCSGRFREQYGLAFNVWNQFKHKARQDGYSTNGALARLIRRYLERGFDDGQPERKDPNAFELR